MCVFKYVYIYIITINGKKGSHDFQAKKGEIVERIWREKREG